MGNARGNKCRTVQGKDDPNSSGHRVSTAELVDFCMAQALKRRIKEVAQLTGLSEKAVANLRLGLSGASAQTISTWCRNDPQFRAEYFAWCGGELEMPPDITAAIIRHLRRDTPTRDFRSENRVPPRKGEAKEASAVSPLPPGARANDSAGGAADASGLLAQVRR